MINGAHLAALFIGVIIGMIVGAIYGWMMRDEQN
jgi:gas vesicle protein